MSEHRLSKLTQSRTQPTASRHWTLMGLFVVMVSLMAAPWMPPALAGDAVSVQLSGGQWKVTTARYVATSGRSGYLGSLIVDGQECLVVSDSGLSGSYLAAGKMPRLDHLASEGNRLTGNCSLADLAYTFTEGRVSLSITSHQDGVHLYMLLNPAVTRLGSMVKIGDVPTVTTVPAKLSTKLSRWYQGETALVDVSGSDSMWMYRGHQLWDAGLAKGETRTIEMATASPSAGPATQAATQAQDTSESFTYADASAPGQIPLCMIGDSITWADHGDDWRRGLLAIHPGFAFIGTHSDKQGYSHAGEGGNSTGRVLSRLPEIPACPYYSLLIGTNDTNIRDAAKVDDTAKAVADRIINIVSALLQKQGVRRVFLCSLLPCHTDNPLRDQTNAAVNVILRDKLAAGLFADKPVTWVELEKPLRALPGWEKLIALHPSPEGYRHMAQLHGEAILAALAIKDHAAPVAKAGTGVRVVNLWDSARQATCAPVIAGWYTVSFDLKTVSGTAPAVRLLGAEGQRDRLDRRFVLDPAAAGKRVTVDLFTDYEGYGYTRSVLSLAPEQCVIDRIQIEKRRPSGLASTYGEGTSIDTTTTPSPGELLEFAASPYP